jgi:hypothetical protein
MHGQHETLHLLLEYAKGKLYIEEYNDENKEKYLSLFMI